MKSMYRFQAISDADDNGASDNEAGENNEAGERERGPSWARRLQQAASVRDGMQRLFEEAPAVYFQAGTRIEPMLTQAIGALGDFQPHRDLLKLTFQGLRFGNLIEVSPVGHIRRSDISQSTPQCAEDKPMNRSTVAKSYLVFCRMDIHINAIGV